jgi:hypothetical protein
VLDLWPGSLQFHGFVVSVLPDCRSHCFKAEGCLCTGPPARFSTVLCFSDLLIILPLPAHLLHISLSHTILIFTNTNQQNVFWLIAHSDPHQAISFDHLHALHLGMWRHLLEELKKISSKHLDVMKSQRSRNGKSFTLQFSSTHDLL